MKVFHCTYIYVYIIIVYPVAMFLLCKHMPYCTDQSAIYISPSKLYDCVSHHAIIYIRAFFDGLHDFDCSMLDYKRKQTSGLLKSYYNTEEVRQTCSNLYVNVVKSVLSQLH